jgi:hypothetical protein
MKQSTKILKNNMRAKKDLLVEAQRGAFSSCREFTIPKDSKIIFDREIKYVNPFTTKINIYKIYKFGEDEIPYEYVNEVNFVRICEWRRVDNGIMGFHDYEYMTTCGRTYKYNTTTRENFCPHCGGKLN